MIINKLSIINFLCFRQETEFDFNQSTYLIGSNNAGKTAIFKAIKIFFNDDTLSDNSFLNRAAYNRRQTDFNKAKISIYLNLNAIRTKRLKRDLSKIYGKELKITKIVTYKETTANIDVKYRLNDGSEMNANELPDDVSKIIESIGINYLHPQEGIDLQKNAQAKLRTRLLSSYGRYQALARKFGELQAKWADLSETANRYLSAFLTDNAKEMWPDSQVYVNLPTDIREIIDISTINFQGADEIQIQLSSQGTGVQSIILYLTHYFLDSDRTLHRGEYHPIWLLEEPESFLHADLMTKLAKKLNSPDWLANIQMIISTHSPIILAASHSAGPSVSWQILKNFTPKQNKTVTDWRGDEIEEIGEMMGDTNFSLYFAASQNKKLIFVEDSKKITINKLRSEGIDVTSGLGGTSEIKKFLDVLKIQSGLISNKAFFIIDSDATGMDTMSGIISSSTPVKKIGGFTKLQYEKDLFLILLPDKLSMEDMFEEFDSFLEDKAKEIWEFPSCEILENTPSNLSSVVTHVKRKKVENIAEAKNLLRSEDDIKYLFWKRAESDNYKLEGAKSNALKSLLNN